MPTSVRAIRGAGMSRIAGVHKSRHVIATRNREQS
jgi:hypothetical protein